MSLAGSDVMGAILAAGKGTRMLPFSERYPKPVLPIGDKPLLLHQILALRKLGVTDIVIAIGHLGHEVVRELGDGSRWGVRLRYVEAQNTHGIAHSLSRLERAIDRPFFLFLGDIYFEGVDLEAMLRRLGSGAREETAGVLAVKREQDPRKIMRNSEVQADGDGRVLRVIEKPRRPQSELTCCGPYLFDVSVFDAVRRTPRTALRDEYELTDAVQLFIDDGWRVEAAEVIDWDLNLSFPSDLLLANLRYLRGQGLPSVVAGDARLHPGCTVENAVVLGGVEVLHPIAIRDAMIFPGTVVERVGPVEKLILTPQHEVPCGSVFGD